MREKKSACSKNLVNKILTWILQHHTSPESHKSIQRFDEMISVLTNDEVGFFFLCLFNHISSVNLCCILCPMSPMRDKPRESLAHIVSTTTSHLVVDSVEIEKHWQVGEKKEEEEKKEPKKHGLRNGSDELRGGGQLKRPVSFLMGKQRKKMLFWCDDFIVKWQ